MAKKRKKDDQPEPEKKGAPDVEKLPKERQAVRDFGCSGTQMTGAQFVEMYYYLAAHKPAIERLLTNDEQGRFGAFVKLLSQLFRWWKKLENTSAEEIPANQYEFPHSKQKIALSHILSLCQPPACFEIDSKTKALRFFILIPFNVSGTVPGGIAKDGNSSTVPAAISIEVPLPVISKSTSKVHPSDNAPGIVDLRLAIQLLNHFYESDGSASQLKPYRITCNGVEVTTAEYVLDEWLQLGLDLRTMSAKVVAGPTAIETWREIVEQAAPPYRKQLHTASAKLENNALYRLMKFVPGEAGSLEFAKTKFFDYRLTPGLLGEELEKAIAESNGKLDLVVKDANQRLPMRSAMLRTRAQLLNYTDRVCAGGVCVVLAMARGEPDNDFLIPLRVRSNRVTDNQGKLAVVPCAFHQPLFGNREEAKLYYTVLREIFEEVFGKEEGERVGGKEKFDWYLHEHAAMKWLHLNKESCVVQATCFGLNAVVGGYEFGVLVAVRDPEFWKLFGGIIDMNWEVEKDMVHSVSTLDPDEIAERLLKHDWAQEAIPAFVEGLFALKQLEPERVCLPAIQRIGLSKVRSPQLSSEVSVSARIPRHFPKTQRELTALGILPAPELTPKFLKAFRGNFAIGDLIEDMDFRDYRGITGMQIVTKDCGDVDDYLPDIVLARRNELPIPKDNRHKIHLKDGSGAVDDQGNLLTLDLLSSKYQTSQAIGATDIIARLQADAVKDPNKLRTFPRRLDVGIVAISSDGYLILMKRRHRDLALYNSLWEISAGESMDGKKDRCAGGLIDPLNTVYRGLSERCEMNLPESVARKSDIRFVALATEWCFFIANLVAIARIPKPFEYIAEQFKQGGEHSHIDKVPFNQDSCLQLLIEGTHEMRGVRGSKERLCDISRYSLLAAWRNEEHRRNNEL